MIPPQKTGKCVLVSALVLETFVGPRPHKNDGCHNDGNPKNNHLTNLRWGTRKSNCSDMVLHNTRLYGEAVWVAKLNPEKVVEIRRMHAAKEGGYKLIGRRFDVSPSTVFCVVKGATWAHV